MTPRHAWVTVLAPMVWGTTYAVTSELLPPGRPLLAGTLRALPAGLCLLAITRAWPQGRWIWRSAVLGLLYFTIFYALLFTAAYRLPGGVAATVGALQPLIVMTLAGVALHERVAPTKVVAGVFGVAGVSLLVMSGTAKLDAIGVLAAIGGATSMALGTTLVQRWGRPSSTLAFAGWQLTAGGLMLLPIALVGEGLPPSLSATNVLGYLYLATLGGVIAYVIWFRGIALLGAQRATFLSLLAPVVATAVGFALGDRLTLRQIGGAALVLVSVTVAQLAGTRPALRTPPTAAASAAAQPVAPALPR